MRVRALAATILAFATATAAEAATRVVIADTSASAVLIWNATPVVAVVVADHVSDAIANDRLERSALRAVATSLTLLPRAKTITVRILYDQTGDVSPVYGGATFTGVERYATLTFEAARGRASAAHWRGLRESDALPKWIAFHVVGALPPR